MVPVKFSNLASTEQQNQPLNFIFGVAVLALLVQIYRTLHGKGPNPSSGSKGGSSFGRGGMNDMFGMSKSNV